MKIFILIFLNVVSFISVLAQTLNSNLTEELKQANTQAITLYQQKKFDEALVFAQKASNLASRLYGEVHLESAKAQRNEGYIYFAIKDNEKAEKSFKNALNIYEKLSAISMEDGASLAEMLEILAFIKTQTDNKDVEKYYQLALNWREKVNGEKSTKNLPVIMSLAKRMFENKEFKDSAELYQKALEISLNDENARIKYFDLAYYRCECAFVKMDKEKDFKTIDEKYSSKLKTDEDKDLKGKSRADTESEVINGKALVLAAPSYPKSVSAIKNNSVVKVKVLINEAGNVISACAVRYTNPFLFQSAESAAYRSKFSPTILAGKEIKVSGIIVYNFQ